jgi:PAS domain S-box-containing protein
LPAPEGTESPLPDEPAEEPALPGVIALWPESVIFTDSDGRILAVNDAAAALTGYPPDLLVGRDVLDLVHLDDRSPVRAGLHALVAGQPGERREFRIVSASGEERWVDALGSNLLDVDGVGALVVHARDCTARREAEYNTRRAALNGREADRRYRVAFETTLVGMATADIDGFYVEVNAALCQLLDRPREQLIGRHLTEVIHPEDAPAVKQSLAQMVTRRVARSIQREIRHVRGDGAVIVAEAALVPICDDDGAALSLMVFTQDVTARHAALAALQSALAREQEASRQLRELEATKGQLLAAVSHDFRTPLTAIAGFAGLLATNWERFDDEQRRDFAIRITRNTTELDDRVTEFLDVARHDHAPDTIELVACRLDEIVDHAIQRCRFVLEAHLVQLDAQEVHLTSEPRSIGRIIDNLLTNAAKYTPPGTTITVVVAQDRDVATVSVIDQGSGIPAADHERIFEPFVRLDDGDTGIQGAGVGLGGARALAQRLGGALAVKDNHPTGSRFTLTLPADGVGS